MKQNSFLARMASKMLAFAVVGMMCVGFTASSKDDETQQTRPKKPKKTRKRSSLRTLQPSMVQR
ncbi:hypothetical protein [Prevotella aurantiaca]